MAKGKRGGGGGLESRWDSASREGLGAVAAGWALARLAWRAGAAPCFSVSRAEKQKKNYLNELRKI